jgi:hypothetical protein
MLGCARRFARFADCIRSCPEIRPSPDLSAGRQPIDQIVRGGHGTDNRPVTDIDRPLPPLNADERTTLESWLDFHRATLAMKCEGLDDDQAATASVPPSGFTLTGLVQHMAEVERNWFRRVLAGEHAGPIFDPEADPDGPDGGFELA